MALQIGDKAPDFDLQDQFGDAHKLSDSLGRKVILYFYPKDNTPGCTTEACSFRDNYALFRANGLQILGVSADSVKSHKGFQEKYSLPFLLLADTDHAVSEAYGVWALKKMMGKEYYGIVRTTFVIDEEGRIMKIYEKVKPEEHAQEIITDLKLA
ncbi:MAG TPA: thioredoxin-dependent thiol peroxidase [Anaerolineaceae bacterium]|jgi:peroxiredoxin Q/BCP|nr:thioredoxin-dependent thiol peroxidase [Anaerolineaceae bacterium]